MIWAIALTAVTVWLYSGQLFFPAGILTIACFFVWSSVLGKSSKTTQPTKKTSKNPGSNDGGYEGRIHIDRTRFAYDDSGNLLDINDGSFTQGLDGRWRDDHGNVLEEDNDGELRRL